MNKGITKENLLFLLPSALLQDPSIMALADAGADVLAARLAEIDRARIISNIDGLDEAVLDILAHDFKVDWWDPEYSVDEKRRTLKGSWRVHKKLGTKAAVETAIRAIYPMSQVEEWFEYNGEPYHFRLNINITSDGGDKVRQKRVLERLNFYKSLRSHNDGVRYFIIPEKAWATAGGSLLGSRNIIQTEIIPPQIANPGGKAQAVTGGALAGFHVYTQTVITPAKLTPPGATVTAPAGGGLASIYQRIAVRPNTPVLTRPGGTAKADVRAKVTATCQRMSVRIQAVVVSPCGTAVAVCGGRVVYGYQSRTVRITISNN